MMMMMMTKADDHDARYRGDGVRGERGVREEATPPPAFVYDGRKHREKGREEAERRRGEEGDQNTQV